jgi:hypothetical protein
MCVTNSMPLGVSVHTVCHHKLCRSTISNGRTAPNPNPNPNPNPAGNDRPTRSVPRPINVPGPLYLHFCTVPAFAPWILPSCHGYPFTSTFCTVSLFLFQKQLRNSLVLLCAFAPLAVLTCVWPMAIVCLCSACSADMRVANGYCAPLLRLQC